MLIPAKKQQQSTMKISVNCVQYDSLTSSSTRYELDLHAAQNTEPEHTFPDVTCELGAVKCLHEERRSTLWHQ